MPLTTDQAERLLRIIRSDEDPSDSFPDSGDSSHRFDLHPETFPGYRLLKYLGRGGLGVVYEAEQLSPHRRVAIKLLRSGLHNPNATQRFRAESEILARLRHPAIAAIHHAGVLSESGEQRPYFVLELIEGATPITDHTTSVPREDRIKLLIRVCQGVHHAHLKGFIHRDLKPSNILVNSEGEPKIIDFGVARILDDDFSLTIDCTESGQILGTVQYMAPEQCDADPTNVDARADVYALGLLLYEILLDRHPYTVPTTSLAAAARAVTDSPPAPLQSVDKSIPKALEAIVLKALEKNPDKRYQSAYALAEDLERFLQGRPVLAKTPSAWQRMVGWIGRHPIATTAIACAILIAATFGLTQLSMWYVYRVPVSLALRPDNTGAAIYARSGAILHEWEGWGAESVLAISRVKTSDPSEEGVFIILVEEKSATNRRVELVDYLAPRQITWTPPDHTFEFPIDTRGMRFDDAKSYMSLDDGLVADIFPDLPGDEIVLFHRHVPWFPTCVRIYNVRTLNDVTLVAEFWYPGYVTGMWDPEYAQMYLIGPANRFPWHFVGVDNQYTDPHARTVAAFKPTREITSRFLIDDQGYIDSRIEWLSVLMPREHAYRFNQTIRYVVPLQYVNDLFPVQIHLPPAQRKDLDAARFYLERSTGKQFEETIVTSAYRARRLRDPDLPDPENPMLHFVQVPLPHRAEQSDNKD